MNRRGQIHMTPPTFCQHLSMEDAKKYVVGWLDWAARYAATDPYDFLVRCKNNSHSVCMLNLTFLGHISFQTALLSRSPVFMILTPLFLISSVLAYFLYKDIGREEKRKLKQGM